jgi:hypothetical protein
MACRSITVDLSLLRPPWKRQRVFGIDCSRSWRQADSMLIGRWTARSMRPPPDFNESTTKVRIALETAAPCGEARAPVPPAMRCGSLGRPMRKPFYGLGWTPARGGPCRRARATCARRGTPSMLVPSSCRLGKSSNFLKPSFFYRFRQSHRRVSRWIRCAVRERSHATAGPSSCGATLPIIVSEARPKPGL